MDLVERVSLYAHFAGGKNALESIDLAEELGVKETIDKLADSGMTYDQVMNSELLAKKKKRGRPVSRTVNPLWKDFCEYMLDKSFAPEFDDLLVGVCRSMPAQGSQKRTTVSPSKLAKVMTMNELTTKGVSKRLGVGAVQASRYIKAANLLIKLKVGG